MDRVLLDYLPPVLKEVREYRAIMAAEQPEIEALYSNVRVLLENQFVESANADGVRRWEKLLAITPKAADTPDDRKFKIMTRLNEQLPYTMGSLKQQLAALCGRNGYTVSLANGYAITVRVALTVKSQLEDVRDLLNRVLPTNLLLDLSLLFNQHKMLHKFRHSQLAAYKHKEIREEVI